MSVCVFAGLTQSKQLGAVLPAGDWKVYALLDDTPAVKRLLGTITSAVDAATLRIRFAGTCVDDLFENFYSRAELKSCKGALPPVAVRFNADRVVVAPVLQLEDKLNGGALRKGTVVVGGVYIEAMGDGGVIVARQPGMGFLFLIRQFVNFFFVVMVLDAAATNAVAATTDDDDGGADDGNDADVVDDEDDNTPRTFHLLRAVCNLLTKSFVFARTQS